MVTPVEAALQSTSVDELLRALEVGDPRALALAVVAWRTTRADGLAGLIDHITARCERLPSIRGSRAISRR